MTERDAPGDVYDGDMYDRNWAEGDMYDVTTVIHVTCMTKKLCAAGAATSRGEVGTCRV